jgi:1-acyl-sn-glycerol-3-phosphate acyltransferase
LKPLFRPVYGSWCWLVFVVVALLALLLALPTPGLARRRSIARHAARAVLLFAGIRLSVSGLERLPAGACVLVANHASYLDGVLLQGALPPRFAFVIKREMAGVPLASLLLRRLGSEFVERFDRHKGGVDARRVLRRAAAGQSLAFFPEGTFIAEPGLGRFHAGAFVAAQRSQVPLVPAVIRGARAVLPLGAALPRRGPVEVEILAPIEAPATELRDGAAQLRSAARHAILARLGEPDLAS